MSDPIFTVLTGTQKVYSLPWASSSVNSAAPAAVTAPVDSTGSGAPAFLGATDGTTDWTQPWAYGIDPDNRGTALWFE